jgi:L-fucose isomerase-like protein
VIPCGSCGNPSDVVFYPGNVSGGMPYCAVDLPNHLRDLIGTEIVVSTYEVLRRLKEESFKEQPVEDPKVAEESPRSSKKKKTSEPESVEETSSGE